MDPTTQLPTNSVHPARQQRILRLCGVDGFGLHIYGASNTGKTAALYPALSVWGEPCLRTQKYSPSPSEYFLGSALLYAITCFAVSFPLFTP